MTDREKIIEVFNAIEREGSMLCETMQAQKDKGQNEIANILREQAIHLLGQQIGLAKALAILPE